MEYGIRNREFGMGNRGMVLVLSVILLLGAGCATTPEEKTSDLEIIFNDEKPVPDIKDYSTVWKFPGVLASEQIEKKLIRLKTAKGDIVFELFADTAPKTVSNFVYLTQSGFYNGLKFHRREEGFVIQGGDPKGNGMGGPGYKFEDELKDSYTYERGIVAMANSGPNTNGSQFFIMLGDTPLQKNYSVFGRVIEGMNVVDQIKIGDVMTQVMVEEKK